MSIRIPDDYREFLRWSDGGEGQIGQQYLSLWATGDIERLNRDYQIPSYLPGVVGVGTDGAGDCFAFDYRSDAGRPVFVRVPLGDLDDASIRVCGANFKDCLSSWYGDVEE